MGRAIVQQLIQSGVQHIHVLDISEPTIPVPGVTYVKCDVGNEAELKANLDQLVRLLAKKKLQITICVNNAGIRHRESLMNLSDASIQRVFNINTFAHIWTTKKLLRDHLSSELAQDNKSKLFVVSVSSVLGDLAPRNLAAYAGSKAAVTQIFESLRQELRPHRLIQLLLVSTGQLDTAMFQDVAPTKQFLAPVVRSDQLAARIVRRIRSERGGVLCAPLYANLLPAVRVLPMWLQMAFRWFTDMDNKVVDPEERRPKWNIDD